MTAHELLADLRRRGFQLIPLPGERLEVRPFSKLPEELREALRQQKAEVLALLQQQESSASPDYRTLYREMVAAVHEDCFLIDPAWLLAHSAFYERIKALDDRLAAIELIGGNVGEYRETLDRLMACGRDGRAVGKREREQAGEKAAMQ